MTIKRWSDVMNTIKLEDEIIEIDAEKQYPFFNNRYHCLSSDVLQKIKIKAHLINSAYLLFQGHCCNLTSIEIAPNEFVIDIFTKGFPQIYLNACCFGPRIQIEINGEFITKVTCVSQNIHHNDRRNIGEDVMRKIDVLELMTYDGIIKLYKT